MGTCSPPAHSSLPSNTRQVTDFDMREGGLVHVECAEAVVAGVSYVFRDAKTQQVGGGVCTVGAQGHGPCVGSGSCSLAGQELTSVQVC